MHTGNLLLENYECSRLQMLRAVVPEYRWLPWHFEGGTPKGKLRRERREVREEREEWEKRGRSERKKGSGESVQGRDETKKQHFILLCLFRFLGWSPKPERVPGVAGRKATSHLTQRLVQSDRYGTNRHQTNEGEKMKKMKKRGKRREEREQRKGKKWWENGR